MPWVDGFASLFLLGDEPLLVFLCLVALGLAAELLPAALTLAASTALAARLAAAIFAAVAAWRSNSVSKRCRNFNAASCAALVRSFAGVVLIYVEQTNGLDGGELTNTVTPEHKLT